MNIYKCTTLVFVFISLCFTTSTHALNTKSQTRLPIQLPITYKENHAYPINNYWVSEKLDGVRGYWNGSQLLTKAGNKITTPEWFTLNWPSTALDGELWIGRNSFEQIVSCVKRKKAGACWQNIRFMVFDSPFHKGTFTERINELLIIEKESQSPYLQVIHQYKVTSNDTLFIQLNNVVNRGGEGLMLNYEHAKYKVGRSANIMKLKRHDDAEATILKHIPGKGKYLNQLGAIQVQTEEGIIFKIGSGFSDDERKNPPAIGSIITFKYIGKTQRGVPKFASFLRQRTIGNH